MVAVQQPVQPSRIGVHALHRFRAVLALSAARAKRTNREREGESRYEVSVGKTETFIVQIVFFEGFVCLSVCLFV